MGAVAGHRAARPGGRPRVRRRGAAPGRPVGPCRPRAHRGGAARRRDRDRPAADRGPRHGRGALGRGALALRAGARPGTGRLVRRRAPRGPRRRARAGGDPRRAAPPSRPARPLADDQRRARCADLRCARGRRRRPRRPRADRAPLGVGLPRPLGGGRAVACEGAEARHRRRRRRLRQSRARRAARARRHQAGPCADRRHRAQGGQLDALRELGIRYGQGYLLGRPVPAREFRASLAA